MIQATEKKVSTVLTALPSVVTGLKYGGLSKYQLGSIYGITPAKACQKLERAGQTMGKMYKHDPMRALSIIMWWALEGDMSDGEMRLRELMLTGRLDRNQLHPPTRR